MEGVGVRHERDSEEEADYVGTAQSGARHAGLVAGNVWPADRFGAGYAGGAVEDAVQRISHGVWDAEGVVYRAGALGQGEGIGEAAVTVVSSGWTADIISSCCGILWALDEQFFAEGEISTYRIDL